MVDYMHDRVSNLCMPEREHDRGCVSIKPCIDTSFMFSLRKIDKHSPSIVKLCFFVSISSNESWGLVWKRLRSSMKRLRSNFGHMTPVNLVVKVASRNKWTGLWQRVCCGLCLGACWPQLPRCWPWPCPRLKSHRATSVGKWALVWVWVLIQAH